MTIYYDHCIECGNIKPRTVRKRCNKCAAQKRWDTPEYRTHQVEAHNTNECRELLSNINKERWNNPELREIASKKRKDLWENNIEFRTKLNTIFASEEYRRTLRNVQSTRPRSSDEHKKRSESIRASWTDERRKTYSIKAKELWTRPGHRQKITEKMILCWENEEYRSEQCQRMKDKWKEGSEYRQLMERSRSSPEFRKLISDISRARYPGLSYDYPLEFNGKLKDSIRSRDNHMCAICEVSEIDNKRRMDVHHIDYDKTNNDPHNLISLCNRCHPKTNFSRDFWEQALRYERVDRWRHYPIRVVIAFQDGCS